MSEIENTTEDASFIAAEMIRKTYIDNFNDSDCSQTVRFIEISKS